MIYDLTDEQKDKLSEYRERYIKIGCSCEEFSNESCISDMNELYVNVLKMEKPKSIIVMDNPWHAWLAVCILSKWRISDQVRAQVRDQVGYQVHAQVRDQVRDQVGAMYYVYPWTEGAFDANIFCFYDFCIDILKLDIKKETLFKYKIWKKTLEYGPIWPLGDFCVVSKKPKKIYKNEFGLHCANGPAAEYDGLEIYALNGVAVPRWLVLKDKNEICGGEVLKEKNAEVRREIVRKIGIEKVVADCGAECIDKNNGYELLLLDLGDSRKRPYLKMQNPSIDAVHIEGVPPDCTTVQSALRWRNGVDEKPLVLT